MITIIIWAGVGLVVLGVGGGIATTATTAFIPALFGLVLIVLGWLARNPARTRLMTLIALGIAALGTIAALANVGRLAGAGGVGLNAATFSNLIMAFFSVLPLGFWAVERMTGMKLLED
ncbi:MULTISPECIES: hypothetical protein [Candidatus Chloroploca]|uniref:Uncharacterized protein n=1 Tax=Candidatus Chloroploca asiatica TaxID=1506545 RepID=A0A2H3LBH2_9CHLR|nr:MULTISPECIES: hypothetical protein [Candidatus Chloroploca]PDV99763.1 hypothetical protein A9Q02_00680 [Candidatus Chloroploca asiatica]